MSTLAYRNGAPQPSEVARRIRELFASQRPCMVLVYARGCPYCDEFKPLWRQGCERVEADPTIGGAIDCWSIDLAEARDDAMDALEEHGALPSAVPTVYGKARGAGAPVLERPIERSSAGLLRCAKTLCAA